MRDRRSSKLPVAVLLLFTVLGFALVLTPAPFFTSSSKSEAVTITATYLGDSSNKGRMGPSMPALAPNSESSSVPPAVHISPVQNQTAAMSQAGVQDTSSQNWEGYVIAGSTGSVQNVTGSWFVPSVVCSQTPSSVSASWIGIDGWSSSTVEQIGTVSECSGTSASYYSWYEFYPQEYMVSISGHTQAGDTINAQVSTSDGIYYLSMCDSTQNWCYQTRGTVNGGATDNSAEWITEAFSSCNPSCQEQPLANFGHTYYGEAFTGFVPTNYAQIGGLTGPIGNFTTVGGDTVYNVEMKGCPSGCPALTSGLSAGGTSFYTSWNSEPTPRDTITTVSPNLASTNPGGTIMLTATVTDTGAGTASPPTGTVSWSANQTGGSFSSLACSLTALNSAASSCAVSFTAPTTLRTLTITAGYPGDPLHSANSSTSSLTAGPTLTLSPSAIDVGQSATIAATVAWTSGTSPYSVTLYSGTSSACSLDTTVVSSETDVVGTSATFYPGAPVFTTYYCAAVTDSETSPVTATTSAAPFTVNAALTATVSPSAPTIDSGQSVTLTAVPSQGTPPYSYQWYTGSTCASGSAISGAEASGYTTAALTSVAPYSVKVMDSSTGTPAAGSCASVNVMVNPELLATISPPPTIESGQSVTLTAVPSQGTPPYSYQWYAGSSCSSEISGQASQSFSTGTLTSSTTYSVLVTDSSVGTPGAGECVSVTVTVVKPVTQPITLTLSTSGPTATFALSGCSVSPTSVAGDGRPHSVTAFPGCTPTISVPPDGATTRCRFAGGVTSITLTTCASGTCSGFSAKYYYQLQVTLAYAVLDGGTPTAPPVSFTQFGSAATPVSASSGTSVTAWIDAGTTATYTNPLGGSTSSERWQTATQTFTASSSTTFDPSYFHQFAFTASYSLSDSSTPTAPTLTSKQFGSSYTPTLTKTPTVYWLDNGASWSLTNPLSGSTTTRRWDASTTTSGTVSGATTLSPEYFDQFDASFAYSVSDSSTPNVNNAVSYTEFGGPFTVTPLEGSTGSTAVWVDASTSATYGTITGTGERWAVPPSQSPVTISAAHSTSSPVTAEYFHQFTITASYSLSDSSTPTAPTLTSKQFGSSYTPTLTKTPTVYWLDNGASWSLTNPLSGSTTTRRWDTSTTTSGTVSGATTLSPEYFDQYLDTLRYAIVDGGAPTAPPVSFTQFGSAATPVSASTGTSVTAWIDGGTTATYTNPLGGSTSSERWQTATPTFTASSSTTFDPSYYNQFTITFGYTTSDSSDIANTLVVGSYTQFGSSQSITSDGTGAVVPASAWVDAGTARVSYVTATSVSGTERWALSSSPASFSVSSSSSTVSESSYYHQYGLVYSYSLSGGGFPTAPSLSCTQFGRAYSSGLKTSAATYWCDDGASWSVSPNPLTGSTTTQRWDSTQSLSGTVSATVTTVFEFYHQYVYTLSYAVTGGGSPTAPTLASTQFGSPYAPTLTTSATGYWLDNGATCSVTNPTTGSTSSERWDANTACPTVSTMRTVVFAYFHQFAFTASYSLSDSSTPTAPTLTSKQFGSSYTPTLTKTPTVYWLDNGASWSLTNPLSGSTTTRRWDTSTTTSGTVSGATTLSPEYFDQYLDTLRYAIVDGGAPTAPPVSFTQFGSAATPVSASTGTSVTAWIDGGTTATYTNPLGGSTSSERWQTATPTFTASSSTTFDPSYYNQFTITFGYTTSDSSDIANTLVVGSYTQFGSSQSITSDGTGAVVPASAWVDAGTARVSYVTATSVSGTERWALSSSPASFSVSSSSSTVSESSYYHQYGLVYSYSLSGGGFPTAPSLSCTQFGRAYSSGLKTSAATYWCDDGASWSVSPNPLTGSTTTQRWDSTQSLSGTVSATVTTVFEFYHQYLVTFAFSVTGGGSGYFAPQVTYMQFGSGTTVSTGSPVWVDASTSYSYLSTLPGSSSTEQWYLSSTVGSITGSGTISKAYVHEFYVTMTASGPGTTSPSGSAWYNAGASISIRATPSSGHTFVDWSSSTAEITIANAKSASTTATINGSGTMTATFV